MKKSLMLTAAAVAAGALITVGGTLAWFTAQGGAVNTVTVGSMEFEFSEDNYTDNSQVMPGARISKDPKVAHTAGEDGYVHIQIKPAFSNNSNLSTADVLYVVKNGEDKTEMTLTELSAYWTEKGYPSAIENNVLHLYGTMKDGKSITVFDEVYFPGDKFGNEYQGEELLIDVGFGAVQVKNNEISTVEGEKPTYSQYQEKMNGIAVGAVTQQ